MAVTDHTKEKIKEAGLYFFENELRKQLKDSTDAKNLIEKLGTPPLQNITEIKEVLRIAAGNMSNNPKWTALPSGEKGL